MVHCGCAWLVADPADAAVSVKDDFADLLPLVGASHVVDGWVTGHVVVLSGVWVAHGPHYVGSHGPLTPLLWSVLVRCVVRLCLYGVWRCGPFGLLVGTFLVVLGGPLGVRTVFVGGLWVGVHYVESSVY